MNQNNIFAIPNGIYSLQQILAEPATKQVIQSLKSGPLSKTRKVRVFLAFYQTYDAVAQLAYQGHEFASMNPLEITATASVAVENGIDKIMKEFTDEDRILLDSLF